MIFLTAYFSAAATFYAGSSIHLYRSPDQEKKKQLLVALAGLTMSVAILVFRKNLIR